MKLLVVIGLIGAVLIFTMPNQANSLPKRRRNRHRPSPGGRPGRPRPRPLPTPTPSPPECTSIYASDDSPGMAQLYRGRLDGNQNYVIVINNDEDPETVMAQMVSMRSGNRRHLRNKILKGPSNGIKAVVSDLNDEELNMIRQMNGVKYVEKEVIFRTSESTSWGLDRIDQQNLPLDNSYLPLGNGDGVFVYVIDTGVNTQHEDFGGRAVNWYDATTGEDDSEDCLGHGTHVAGTVAAEIYGVADRVNIRSVRVFGCENGASSSDIVDAINHILTNGPGEIGSVVSMSLGGPPSVVLDEAVNNLIRAGFVVAVAAGNENQDACNVSPARVSGAITVGATDREDQRASFSNFGIGVNIFAPGVGITSLDHLTNTGTRTISGTSMATPHVSGVAAILLSSGVPASEVREKIFDLSTKNVVADPKESSNRLLFTCPSDESTCLDQ